MRRIGWQARPWAPKEGTSRRARSKDRLPLTGSWKTARRLWAGDCACCARHGAALGSSSLFPAATDVLFFLFPFRSRSPYGARHPVLNTWGVPVFTGRALYLRALGA